jgi:ATP-binding cassette subfamily B protein
MDALKCIYEKTYGIRRYFVLAFLCVGIESVFELVIPLLMADLIDAGILEQDTSMFATKGIAMLLCALLSLIFGLLYAKSVAKASSKLGEVLRNQEFEAIENYDFSNIDAFESSSLQTRLTADVQVVQNAVTSGLRPLARGPFILVLGLVSCFFISWRLSLVFVVVCPILAGILLFVISKVAPSYPKLQAALDELNTVVAENILAIRIVKAFVRDEFEEEKFEKLNKKLADLTQNTFHYAQLNQPAFQLTMYTALLTLLALGSLQIMDGTLQVGSLTGLLSYVLQILNSFMMLSNVFLLMSRSMASITRIAQVFETKPKLSSPEKPKTMQDGSVEFEHVTFRYHDKAKRPVLDDVSFAIESGSSLGILGATGSAKSSLVSLIDRLYETSQGSIKVGKQDVRDLNLHDLHEQVGVVLQINQLFAGTIESNLKWGNPNATQKEMRDALETACASEFVFSQPQGLQREISQNGTNVSGGQRQRLCIARALLKNPKILIFDDSFSALDMATDAKLRAQLACLKGLTRIFVAQRIDTVLDCDKILVLHEGKLVDFGSHEELMERCEIYQEIYTSQKGGKNHE